VRGPLLPLHDVQHPLGGAQEAGQLREQRPRGAVPREPHHDRGKLAAAAEEGVRVVPERARGHGEHTGGRQQRGREAAAAGAAEAEGWWDLRCGLFDPRVRFAVSRV